MIEVMQKTVLSGMYAVSYDAENSSCTFETNKRETILTETASFPLKITAQSLLRLNWQLISALFEDEQPFYK